VRVFEVGDQVLVKSPIKNRKKATKLPWDCLSEVTEVHRNNRYYLKCLEEEPPIDTTKLFSAGQLILAAPIEDHTWHIVPDEPRETEAEEDEDVALKRAHDNCSQRNQQC